MRSRVKSISTRVVTDVSSSCGDGCCVGANWKRISGASSQFGFEKTLVNNNKFSKT
jgi:hypothetical protein